VSVEELLAYIKMCARLRNHADSLEALLLKHGEAFSPAPVPKGIRKGKDGLCFMNAGKIASGSGSFRYAEGYATTKDLGLPFHHGWLVNSEGRAIDPTWRERGELYYGISFSSEELDKALLLGKHWGLLGYRHGKGHIVLAEREKKNCSTAAPE
jgi:hypothetical protein